MAGKINLNTQKSISKITEKSIGQFAGKAGKEVTKNLNPLAVLQEYFSYKKATESEITRREEIQARREIAVATIQAQKEALEQYFHLRFEERATVLSELFKLLDNAVDKQDINGLDGALNGILDVVKDNPLKDFESFRDAFISGKTIEI